MSELKDELDPPFGFEPAEGGAGRIQFPHSGSVYPRAFRVIAARHVGTAPPEDSFVDELALGVVPRGYPMRAHFRAATSTSIAALRARSPHVRGRPPSFANTRSMRVARARHGRQVVGDARRSTVSAFRR
jgi:hypothetical protein